MKTQPDIYDLKADLDAALNKGLITQEEYNEELAIYMGLMSLGFFQPVFG